jgi:hypothetical protein
MATEKARLQAAGKTNLPRRSSSSRWMQRFEELIAFQKRFGHCYVSTLDKEFASLGNWVRHQRGERRRGRLSAERIQMLDELGFAWNLSGKVLPHIIERDRQLRMRWESMYRVLAAYHQAHGCCPTVYRSNARSRLERWCAEQRTVRQRGKLSEEQVRRLDGLGFVWNLQDGRWEKMFAELVEYKRKHANVPTGIGNRRLCIWIAKQRACYRRGCLPPDRKKRLQAIGFRWSGPR